QENSQLVIITTNASYPSLFGSPHHLRIEPPIVKRFRDRKRIICAMACLETAIHELRLPFHKRKTAFSMGAFPFVKKVCAVNLSSRIRAGLVGATRSRNTSQHSLRIATIKRLFETWIQDEI